MTETGPPRIVVGVDGSPCSQEALVWAVRQARLTGAAVHAVISWRWPDVYGYAAVPTDIDWEGSARELLAKTVRRATVEFPDVHVEQRVREGHPAPLLMDEARGASLLVVGSRGHGAFAGMLLGSVSEHCVRQAPCPVVVVRAEPAVASDAASDLS